jgi:mRNA-degrading endonuclease toxin of MazEF toxin-antitoxin module
MTDKIVTVKREELGTYVGKLTDEQMREISRQLAKILCITKEDLE